MSLTPSLMRTKASEEQKPMCVSVSAIGKGNPLTASTYLLIRMTAALSTIQSTM